MFKISRSTLHNHVHGIHRNKPRHPTVISAAEEVSLVTHITVIPAHSPKNTGHFTGLQKPISLHLLGIIVSQQYSISSDVGGQ